MAIHAAVTKILTSAASDKETRMTLLKLLGGVIAFILIVVMLCLMPILSLGAALFPDNSTPEGARIAAEMAKASGVDFTTLEQNVYEDTSAEVLAGITLGEGSFTSTSDINVQWDVQELLILYEIRYGTDIDKPLDFSEFYQQAQQMVNRQSALTTSESLKPKENEEDEDEYVTNYHFGYTSRLKSFTELLDVFAFDPAQKARALMMQRYLYGQTQGQLIGNDIVGLDIGDITYTDSVIPVVYFNQRDKRWATSPYGQTGTMARSGCGPTALAIAISSLKSAVTPVDVAQWSAQHGYYAEGGGSYHSLVPAACKEWGVPVTGVGTSWQKVVDALAQGKLVIAIMGAGHFTSSGHFIVLRGITSDGKVLVADPVSVKRSGEQWNANIIVTEARKGATAGGPFWVIG